jgi:hypothetical protein
MLGLKRTAPVVKKGKVYEPRLLTQISVKNAGVLVRAMGPFAPAEVPGL